MNFSNWRNSFWFVSTETSSGRKRMRGRHFHSSFKSPQFDICEARTLLTLPATLTIPLIPELDQFGDQILVVQGFGVPERSALGIFDTGASAVTFGAQDQDVFGSIESGPIPIKVPGGAAAGGIGGEITGDVSEPGTIFSDGMHAFNLTFDEFGFPLFDITLSPSALETPGIQAFVGTESSPLLPTITGTPALNPSPKYPTGAAAIVDMQGALIDFSDIFPGLVIPFPDLSFTTPGTALNFDPANTDLYEPVTFPLVPFGGDNHDNPGDLITESLLWMVPGITSLHDTVTSTPGSFLFDTGAQLSVISTDMALSLGLDLENPVTSIDVQGVAGTETIAGFTLDTLNLPRSDGGLVQYTDVPIYVLDVAPGIDGIIGMNLMNIAKEFVFDPLHPEGPQLSVSYFANPDRTTGIDIGSELAALLGGSLGILSGSVGGTSIPGFVTPANTPTTPEETTTQLIISTSSVEFGADFSVTVQVSAPTGEPVPTGQVVLKQGTDQVLATLPLNDAGLAVWDSGTVSWPVGNYAITAVYEGDSGNLGSESVVQPIEIVKAASSLVINGSSEQTVIGNTIVIAGSLKSSTTSAMQQDQVQILMDGQPLGFAAVSADGTFSYSVTAATVGSHSIQALFPGSATLTASQSNTIYLTVTPASAQLILQVPQNVVFGQTFAVNAVIDPVLAGAYNGASVTFYNGRRMIGQSTMENASASLNLRASRAGQSFQLRAVVRPAAPATVSWTTTQTITVGRAATSLSWSTRSLPRNMTEWRIVAEPVQPGSGSPTGLIRIRTGGTRPRMMLARVQNGMAVLRTRGNAIFPISFTYAGDRNFEGSSTIL
ncbi:MAG: hypothetical protein RJA81_517 [Planctomycetota bacterium]|jgi:hypothetical protein